MSKKNERKRRKVFGRTVAPHVNFTCAVSLEKVLDYACGHSETEPSDRDYEITDAFLNNLKLEVSDRKEARHRRKKAAATGSRRDELKSLIKEQQDDMAETGH